MYLRSVFPSAWNWITSNIVPPLNNLFLYRVLKFSDFCYSRVAQMGNWGPLGACCFYPALWPCVLSLLLGWLLFWMGRKCS